MNVSLANLRKILAVLHHMRYERLGFQTLPMVDVSSDQTDMSEAVRWLGPIDIAGHSLAALKSSNTSKSTTSVVL